MEHQHNLTDATGSRGLAKVLLGALVLLLFGTGLGWQLRDFWPETLKLKTPADPTHFQVWASTLNKYAQVLLLLNDRPLNRANTTYLRAAGVGLVNVAGQIEDMANRFDEATAAEDCCGPDAGAGDDMRREMEREDARSMGQRFPKTLRAPHSAGLPRAGADL